MSNIKTVAFLLAGGKGKRMLPLTEHTPKPLLKVGGQSLLQRLLTQVAEAGITEAVVCGGEKSIAKIIKNEVETLYRGNTRLRVTVSEDEKNMGTAGSVLAARRGEIEAGKMTAQDRLLVLCGDCLMDDPLDRLLCAHEKRGGTTLLLQESDTPTRFGQVHLAPDGSGRILSFTEKPAWCRVSGEPVSTGVYLLDGRVADLLPEDIRDFGADVWQALLRMGEPVYGVRMEGKWRDVGTPEEYYACCIEEKGGKSDISPLATLLGRCVIKRSVIMEDCLIGERARIEGAVIGRGCVIGREASVGKGCVLGDYCTVGDGAVLEEGCVLPGGTSIAENTTVRGSGRRVGVHFGDNCIPVPPELGREAITRLGTALALAARELPMGSDGCGKDLPAVIGDSGGDSIRRRLLGGMAAVGDAVDLGNGSAAMGRYLAVRCGFPLTVGVCYSGKGVFRLELFDRYGMYPGSRTERAVADGWREAPAVRYGGGQVLLFRGSERSYGAALRKCCPPIPGRRVGVSADAGLESDAAILRSILAEKGGNTDNAGDGLHFRLEKGEEGSRLTAEDRKSRTTLSSWQIYALIAGFRTRHSENPVALPEAAPEALKRMIGRSGCKLLLYSHTRSDEGEERARAVASGEHWLWDGCFAAAELLRVMANTGAGLRELAMLIPAFRFEEKDFLCDPAREAMILRTVARWGTPTFEGILRADENGGYVRVAGRNGGRLHLCVEAANETDLSGLVRRASGILRRSGGKREK